MDFFQEKRLENYMKEIQNYIGIKYILGYNEKGMGKGHSRYILKEG